MATQVLSDISAALSTYFDGELQRQFNRTSVLCEALPKLPGGGKSVNWDARLNRTTHAAAFTEGADVAAGEFNVDPTVPAVLPWGQYRVAFSLSGISVAAAATSPGSAVELLDQFQSNLEDAASDLVSIINSALYTGTGANNQIAGLTGAGALALTGTYAGILRSTYSDWAANVSANGGTARNLTKGIIDTLEAAVYRSSGKTPRLIVTTPEVVTKYESLFANEMRVQVDRGELSPIPNMPNVGAPFIPSNTGYTGLTYKGIPVLRDRDCPTGKLFFLNPDFVNIRVLPQANLGTVSRSENRQAPAGISVRVESLAKTGDADKFQLVSYLQLQVKRPNTCGVLADISES